MAQLTVNADDGGMDAGRDAGLLVGILAGVVSAVSVLVTRRSLLTGMMVAAAARRRRPVRVGLHVDLTDGPFLTPGFAETFFAGPRTYPDKREFWSRAVYPGAALDALRAEVEAQVAAFGARFGFVPHHLDGHNHAHVADPRVFRVFRSVADACGICSPRVPDEPLAPPALWTLACLDAERGQNTVGLAEAFLRDGSLPPRETLVARMRASAVCDALLYRQACGALGEGGGPCYRGTVFGWAPSFAALLRIWREAAADTRPTLLVVHPGLNLLPRRSPSFSSPARARELLLLVAAALTHRAVFLQSPRSRPGAPVSPAPAPEESCST